MSPAPVTKALIPCGGKGTLMSALTGCLIRGDFLDVGLPSGYVEADSRFGGGGKQQ